MTNKNIIYLLLIWLCSHSLMATPYQNLYEKLAEVNVQWHYQTDIPQEVFSKTAILDETAAIQTHLQYVEATLRQRTTAHLTEKQRANRNLCLDYLHTYWQQAQFPKNVYLPYRNPVFIDKYDNFCAVGYLVKATGFEKVSRQISANQNFKYVYEIQSEALLNWAKTYGFTLAELAWIQPGYPPTQPTEPMKSGVGGRVNDIALGIFGTDEIHVGGAFPEGVSVYYAGIAGYDWMAEASVVGEVNAVEFYNNLPVIAGNLTTVNTMPVSNVILLAPNGSGIQQMGTLESTVYDLEYFNHDLYAAGNFGIKKWDGNAWVSVITTDGTVQKMYVFKNELYFGGTFNTVNGQTHNNIAKFNGTDLSNLANGVNFSVYAITAYQNEIYVGGDFLGVGGGNPPVDTGYVWHFSQNQWGYIEIPFIGAAIYSLENVADVNLYVGGSFSYQPMMGTYGNNLVKMQKWGTGFSCDGKDLLNQPVRALRYSAANQKVYVGGDFSAGMNPDLNGIGYFTDNTVSVEPPKTTIFNLYPNPTQDILHASFKNNTDLSLPVMIYDLSGKLLIESKAAHLANEGISVAHFPTGIYVLKVGETAQKFEKH